MAAGLTVDELRTLLRSPRAMAGRAVEIARCLSALEHDGADPRIVQELVLRALEHRACFGEAGPVIDGLVHTLGLFPYLRPHRLAPRERAHWEHHRPGAAGDGGVVFHRVQWEVYRALLDGRNVVLSAPTSFGKSRIVDALVATQRFRNIVLIVPTVALIDETRRRLARCAGRYKIITHASQRRTMRNLFVLTQERFLELEPVEDVEFFVIDEFYKLDPGVDAERSLTLNHALYRLLKHGAQLYMTGPNIEGIARGFAETFGCTFIASDYATVACDVHALPARSDRARQLVELCRALDGPALVYCASPARANQVVAWLADATPARAAPALREAAEWLGHAFHEQWLLARGLAHGIGLHHGKVPRAVAAFMVRAFNEGLIERLVCTSSLIEGVNTRAKHVVVFDNKVARRTLDTFTFNNIKGRSGRMFHHFVGHVHVFHPPPRAGLPMVDIPMFTQDASAPESLLVQLDDADLSEPARRRVRPIRAQTVLGFDVIRSNAGIAPAAQIALAREIAGALERYQPLLVWTAAPTYTQLQAVCELIWTWLVRGRGRLGTVSSGRQLAFRIHRLSTVRGVRALLDDELRRGGRGPDTVVEEVLEFARRWASFDFPRYLDCVDRIQRSVFARRTLPAGDYTSFRSRVESLVLDSTLLALEEYGLPVQVAQKIAHVLRPEAGLDAVLERLRSLDASRLGLGAFETELLRHTQRHL